MQCLAEANGNFFQFNLLFIVQCILKIIKSFYSWNFGWCLNCFVSHLWYQIKIRNMWIMMFWSNFICYLDGKFKKVIFWSTLFTWLKGWKTVIMAIFAILSKDTEELIFDQLCYNGEKYGKLLFWSYLPSWAKLRIKWYWAKFPTLNKRVVNDYFDNICHTEQRRGKVIIWPHLLLWAKHK